MLNRRHAIVRFKAKTYIVDMGATDDDEIISLGDEKSLHLSYGDKTVDIAVVDPDSGKPKIKTFTWSQLWLKSPYAAITPRASVSTQSTMSQVNSTCGGALRFEPSEGSCDKLLNHIHNVICRGVKEHSDAFVDFLALGPEALGAAHLFDRDARRNGCGQGHPVPLYRADPRRAHHLSDGTHNPVASTLT